MKKLISFLFIFLSACSFFSPKEEPRFLNPLFYQPMEKNSYFIKDSELILITPTSYYVQNAYGYRKSAQCKMLENTMNTVVLQCLHLPEDKNDPKALIITGYDNPPEIWTYKFYIWPKEEQPYNDATLLRIYHYFKDEKDYETFFPYYIHNSQEDYIKQWGDLIATHHKNLTNINELILPSQ